MRKKKDIDYAIQSRLLSLIRQRLGSEKKLKPTLMELLQLNEDAAYKRVACLTPLTIEEFSVLCNHYYLSADEVMSSDGNLLSFRFHSLVGQSFEQFSSQLQALVTSFNKSVANHVDRELYSLFSEIPVYYLLPSKELSLFKAYVWYESVCEGEILSFEEFYEKMLKNENLMLEYERMLSYYITLPSYEVCNDSVLDPIINRIAYYRKLKVFGDTSLSETMIKQLFDVTERLQQWTSKGKKPNGVKFNLYVSSLSIDANTTLISGETMEVRQQTLNTNTIITTNPQYCALTKRLIEDMMKKSILISNAARHKMLTFFDRINKKIELLVCLFMFTVLPLVCAAQVQQLSSVNPLDLEFHRLGVRRFIFSNNLPLSEFKPSEIVAFSSMHPPFTVDTAATASFDSTFKPRLSNGKLILDATTSAMKEVCFYVGAVNPYATYDLDIDELNGEAEAGIDLAQFGLRERVQVTASAAKGIQLKVWHKSQMIKDSSFVTTLPDCPFKLHVQLYGRTLGVFTEKDAVTTYHGHLDDNPYSAKADTFHFGNVLDFRDIKLNSQCTFNVIYNLKGQAVISGARSYLSAGIGQADLRAVSYEDLTPYISDDGRLWFTFSMRGIGIRQPSQGVLSLDPSVFDVRFEGAIVFDFGDGMLRNAVATHLFYDRNAKEWRGLSCDFGGSNNREGRSESHLFTARSLKDPRRGFSIMQAELITNDRLIESHEDPCLFYDSDAGKWRLLTSSFASGGIEARMFEADRWNGKYTEITPAIKRNSTGTVIQKIGGVYYCLMGGSGENLRVHSYPDLKFLGHLNLDLQPHWPQPAARVWAQVVPLPEGYPYRFVLLTMDRPNFTGVKDNTWSYGALYFYGANP